MLWPRLLLYDIISEHLFTENFGTIHLRWKIMLQLIVGIKICHKSRSPCILKIFHSKNEKIPPLVINVNHNLVPVAYILADHQKSQVKIYLDLITRLVYTESPDHTTASGLYALERIGLQVVIQIPTPEISWVVFVAFKMRI